MTEYIVKAVIVFLWSSVKYVVGFLTALVSGFNFLETLLFNVGGGMLGVVVYMYLWQFIVRLRKKLFPPKPFHGIRINRTRRFLVKVVKKYEIIGVVILTPVVLTVPVGTMIAVSIERNKWKIKRMMLLSFIGWTVVMYGIYELFGIRLDELWRSLF